MAALCPFYLKSAHSSSCPLVIVVIVVIIAATATAGTINPPKEHSISRVNSPRSLHTDKQTSRDAQADGGQQA